MRRINEDRYQQDGGGPLLSKLFDAAESELLPECKTPENCKKGGSLLAALANIAAQKITNWAKIKSVHC